MKGIKKCTVLVQIQVLITFSKFRTQTKRNNKAIVVMYIMGDPVTSQEAVGQLLCTY